MATNHKRKRSQNIIKQSASEDLPPTASWQQHLSQLSSYYKCETSLFAVSVVGFFMLFIMNEKKSDSEGGGGATDTEDHDMDFEQDSKLRKRTSKTKRKSVDSLKF